jgi:hypothetical protein
VRPVLAAGAPRRRNPPAQQLTFRPEGAIRIDRPGSMYRWDQPPMSTTETPCQGGGISDERPQRAEPDGRRGPPRSRPAPVSTSRRWSVSQASSS